MYIICFRLFVGDKLGVHQVTDFVRSFSTNYPCRLHTVTKVVLQITEDEPLLWTVKGYDNDVKKNVVSKTGISGKYIINVLKSFYALENITFDNISFLQ